MWPGGVEKGLWEACPPESKKSWKALVPRELQCSERTLCVLFHLLALSSYFANDILSLKEHMLRQKFLFDFIKSYLAHSNFIPIPRGPLITFLALHQSTSMTLTVQDMFPMWNNHLLQA